MYIQDLQRPAEWIMTKYMADMAKLYKTGQDLQVISKSNVNPKAEIWGFFFWGLIYE